MWITTAGHPDTFRAAGKAGARLLTHLLGQSVEELSEKIKIYRHAWRQRSTVAALAMLAIVYVSFAIVPWAMVLARSTG